MKALDGDTHSASALAANHCVPSPAMHLSFASYVYVSLCMARKRRSKISPTARPAKLTSRTSADGSHLVRLKIGVSVRIGSKGMSSYMEVEMHAVVDGIEVFRFSRRFIGCNPMRVLIVDNHVVVCSQESLLLVSRCHSGALA